MFFSSKFLTQIWHFPRSQCEKIPSLANFECQKKFFWVILSKICFHSFVGLDLENTLSTHNMVISLELKAKKSFWWKNQKTFFECPFEIIGFMCWPNFFPRKDLIKLSRKHFYTSFISHLVFSAHDFEFYTYARSPL